MSKPAKKFTRAAWFSFLLTTIATSATWASAQTPATPPAKIHVRVYEYAQVPFKVLTMTEDQAGMIFRQAGLEVTWENSIPPKDPSKAKPTSPRPPDAAAIDLRLVAQFDPIAGALRYDAMGFAVPPDTATISLAWVEKLASLGIAEEYQVLGVAIAHEIGHLFLGPNSHSPAGIMRAGWKEQNLLEASQARLTFTPDQARRIRTEVRHRQEQQGWAGARQTTGVDMSSATVK
jgi:hypothetical protein